MAQVTDIDNIKLITYDIFFGGIDLGLTTVGTVNVTLGEVTIPIDDADQFVGTVKSFSQGFNTTVEMELKKADFDTLMAILAKTRATPVFGSGGKRHFGIGNKKVQLTEIADELLLRPTGSGTDRSEDILLHKAIPNLEAVVLAGNRDAAQVLSLTWTIFPDLNQAEGFEVGLFGDPTAVAVDPEGVWIAAGKNAASPGVTLTALDLNAAQHEQMQGFAFFSDDSSDTAAINDGTDIAPGETVIAFDTGSGTNIFSTSDYIKIGSEIMFITDVVNSTATTGTLTVDRAVNGTVEATHLDDAVITLLENIGITNITDRGNWLSSSAANVFVGDVFQGTFSPLTGSGSRKGVISHVSAGSGNITIDFGPGNVASPDLVVTAN